MRPCLDRKTPRVRRRVYFFDHVLAPPRADHRTMLIFAFQPSVLNLRSILFFGASANQSSLCAWNESANGNSLQRVMKTTCRERICKSV